jgi:hypothetical protein
MEFNSKQMSSGMPKLSNKPQLLPGCCAEMKLNVKVKATRQNSNFILTDSPSISNGVLCIAVKVNKK